MITEKISGFGFWKKLKGRYMCGSINGFLIWDEWFY
jgi:hypothetical protein